MAMTLPMTNETPRTWSPAQQAIFDWFEFPERNRSRNLVVNALAGTGKTTTIIEAITHAPEQYILLAAFNKSIATELQNRLQHPGAEAFTLHSIGYQCVKKFWRGVRVDSDNRSWNLARTVVGCRDTKGLLSLEPGAVEAPFSVVRLMAGLNTKVRELVAFPTVAEIQDLMVEYELTPDEALRNMGWSSERLATLTIGVLETAATIRPPNGIDFADMLFLPVRNSWMIPAYDAVVVDEAQDMSQLQITIARGVLKEGGRLVAVGDPNQGIYGFRGADTGSLGRLKAELDADELPLHKTYRCGRAIVDVAREIVPAFEAGEDNPPGSVLPCGEDEMLEVIGPGDFLLSRINAPMVSLALKLIRMGKRTRIQGRDIGAGLKALVTKLATGRAENSLPEWLDRLQAWETEEAKKAEDRDMMRRVDAVHDQAETLRVLADGVKAVREITGRIEQLFNIDPSLPGFIVCSSVHRAKGLEANVVYVLKDTLNLPVPCDCGHRHGGKDQCPRCACKKYTVNEVAAQEERNLTYVAVTRAKQQLWWVVRGEEAV
jgi:superfamily I DNA/RNA helicase